MVGPNARPNASPRGEFLALEASERFRSRGLGKGPNGFATALTFLTATRSGTIGPFAHAFCNYAGGACIIGADGREFGELGGRRADDHCSEGTEPGTPRAERPGMPRNEKGPWSWGPYAAP